MKTQQEIETKLKEFKQTWVKLSAQTRGHLNKQIHLLEWVLDCEPGLLKSNPKILKICNICKKKFYALTKRRLFCSDSCRVKSYERRNRN